MQRTSTNSPRTEANKPSVSIFGYALCYGHRKTTGKLNISVYLTIVIGKRSNRRCLHGLMYADDIVLLANNTRNLQRLANMCGNSLTYPGLRSITEKSGIIISNENTSNDAILIEQQVMPIVNEYTDLDAYINKGKTYSSIHQDNLMKVKRNAVITKHKALWGCNKYKVL